MSIRVAAAPVSWGAMESFEPPPGYPYSRVLDEMAEAGYEGTELGPFEFLPSDPSVLCAELEKRNLSLASAFIAVDLGQRTSHADALSQAARTAELISRVGCGLLILADDFTNPTRCGLAGRRELANQASWNESEWEAARDAILEIRCLSVSRGLKLAFHPHVGSHVETPEEVEKLLGLFAAEDLGLCLDTGHCLYGGGDPVAWLSKYSDRIRCVHLKDIHPARLEDARERGLDFFRAVREGVFVPLGLGCADFRRITTALEESQFDGWVVVEQDRLPHGRGGNEPLADAIGAREFLEGLGL